MKKIVKPTLYMMTVEAIHNYIEENNFEPGAMLPPENELCERLGVSRGTLREAMRALVEEGLIQRKQGIGTVVCNAQRPIKSTLDINEGVTEMIKGRGMVPGAQDTKVYEVVADKRLAAKLELKPGTPVVCIERVRTANGQKVAFTKDYLPESLLGKADVPQIVDGSLYSYIEDVLGIQLADSVLTIKAVKAKKELARILGVKPGALLMFLQQTDHDQNQKLLVYSEEYFNAERFEFLVVRRRRNHYTF